MSYGAQMFSDTGQLRLDIDETFTRLVHVETLSPLYSGTFSVPGFDDTRGFFIPFFSILDVTVFENSNPHAIPVMSWNNTTKVMTVSPHTLPSGWEGATNVDPAYKIAFYHYG